MSKEGAESTSSSSVPPGRYTLRVERYEATIDKATGSSAPVKEEAKRVAFTFDAKAEALRNLLRKLNKM